MEDKKDTGIEVINNESNLPSLSQEEQDAIRNQVEQGMNNLPIGDIIKHSFAATLKAFASGKVDIKSIVTEAMTNTVIEQKAKQMALGQSETTAETKPISLNEKNDTNE